MPTGRATTTGVAPAGGVPTKTVKPRTSAPTRKIKVATPFDTAVIVTTAAVWVVWAMGLALTVVGTQVRSSADLATVATNLAGAFAMISALTEMNSMARCIELGAVDYLLKPFNPVLLKARLGATLEKKRLRDEVDAHLARLQEELDAARRLQMAMVPQSFPAPSEDFPIDQCASMEPAREVGGDLYDFFITEDGMLCFLVGDVSGKGMAAALFMARTKSLIRIATELMRSRQGASARPADIIARVNRELCQNNGYLMFVTLFFAMLGPKSGELEFCNAGHNAPYRLNGQRLEVIEGAKGIILGVRPDAVYTTGRTSLAPGEGIYVFTDGITEAANEQGELFAEARLEAVLRAAAGCSTAAEIVTSVAQAVRGFVGNALPSDDITMLAVRRLDKSAL